MTTKGKNLTLNYLHCFSINHKIIRCFICKKICKVVQCATWIKIQTFDSFFTVQVMDNVLFSRTLRQCTFTCLNISVHYETLPFNIIIFLKQVTKDYFCSIFSWLYYLLLQIPPIKITVVYAKYFQILKSIESNWDSNIQTYGTTKPNTNFSIS